MKAAVFHGAGTALVIEEVPTPEPGPEEILVRVAACGVCHTDLHYLDHGTPTFKPPPIILGHEISGTVAVAGNGFEAGERVLLPAVLTCGRCTYCREGRENICEHSVMLGNNVDGGYAEYVVAPAKDVFRLPAEIPLIEGAIIADAITTPFHAVVRRARVAPGDWVVVFGCGGIGLNVVQLAAAVGGRVVAVDVSDAKLERARATRRGGHGQPVAGIAGGPRGATADRRWGRGGHRGDRPGGDPGAGLQLPAHRRPAPAGRATVRRPCHSMQGGSCSAKST